MAIETLRSLIASAFKRESPQSAGTMSLAQLDALMDAQFGQQTYTGKCISTLTALQNTTVWACVERKASDFAALPMMTWKLGEAGRELAQDHYLWRIWQYEANPFMTAFRCKHLMQTWLDLYGNAYAELETNGRGQVVAIWPWHPARTEVRFSKGGLFYSYTTEDGTKRTIPHDYMLHIRGMSLDGVTGLNPIEYHRQTIGLSLAMLEHGARFYGNGARPLGVLETAEQLSDTAVDRLRKEFEEKHMGLANSHRLAILEEGLKYKEVGLKQVDAQYLESMSFGVEDICRIFKMPPHKVGHLARATNNNIEFQGREYVDNTIAPLSANWEQEIEFAMLAPRDRGNVFVRVNFRKLMRGDMKSQAEYYTKLVNGMIMAPNEAREDLEMNPMPLKKADQLWVQGAMVAVSDNMPETPVAQITPTQSAADAQDNTEVIDETQAQ